MIGIRILRTGCRPLLFGQRLFFCTLFRCLFLFPGEKAEPAFLFWSFPPKAGLLLSGFLHPPLPVLIGAIFSFRRLHPVCLCRLRCFFLFRHFCFFCRLAVLRLPGLFRRIKVLRIFSPAALSSGQILPDRAADRTNERQNLIRECTKGSRKTCEACIFPLLTGSERILIRIKVFLTQIVLTLFRAPEAFFLLLLFAFQKKILFLHEAALQLRLLIFPAQVQIIRFFPALVRIREQRIRCHNRLVQISGESGLCLCLGFFHDPLRGPLRLKALCILFRLLLRQLLRLFSGFLFALSLFRPLAALCLFRCVHMDLHNLTSDSRAFIG